MALALKGRVLTSGVARVMRLGLGLVWAASMLLFGIKLWTARAVLLTCFEGMRWVDRQVLDQFGRGVAVFSIAGSTFVFMFFVADELCPRTPISVSGFLQLLAGAMAIGALCWAGWLLWLSVI